MCCRSDPAYFRIIAGGHSKSQNDLTGHEVIAEIESFHPVSYLSNDVNKTYTNICLLNLNIGSNNSRMFRLDLYRPI